MEGISFSRAYRFYSRDEPRVVGTVFRPPGGRESWIAIVDDTNIRVLMAEARDYSPRSHTPSPHAFPRLRADPTYDQRSHLNLWL